VKSKSIAEQKIKWFEWFLPWRLPHKLRTHFIINLVIGIVIALVFHVMESKNWGEGITNIGFDLMVRYENKLAHTNYFEDTNSTLFFIDITKHTFKEWGEPYITPRSRIARLINFAVKCKANVVILDILLEKADCYDPNGDKELKSVIHNLVTENIPTKIIIPLRIDSDGVINKTIIDDLIAEDTKLVKDKKKKARTIYTAVPTVTATPDDLVVRYWSVYQMGTENGLKKIVWSIPMVACSLFSKGSIDDLERAASSILSNKSLGTNHEVDKELVVNFSLPAKTVMIPRVGSSTHDEIYTQRIRYKVPRDLSEKFVVNKIDLGTILLTADQILAPQNDVLPVKNLDNRIVLIGVSSPDARDMHQTVIGQIPGMYILGNSINTDFRDDKPDNTELMAKTT